MEYGWIIDHPGDLLWFFIILQGIASKLLAISPKVSTLRHHTPMVWLDRVAG
jgi:hypothetical protein